MAGTWIDTGIVTLIIFVFLAIMYNALKRPIDAAGRGLKAGLLWVKDTMSGEESTVTESITYD